MDCNGVNGWGWVLLKAFVLQVSTSAMWGSVTISHFPWSDLLVSTLSHHFSPGHCSGALQIPTKAKISYLYFFQGSETEYCCNTAVQYIIWATKPSPRSAWANLNPPPKSKLILLSQSCCCLISGVFEVGLWLHLSLNRRLQFDGRR